LPPGAATCAPLFFNRLGEMRDQVVPQRAKLKCGMRISPRIALAGAALVLFFAICYRWLETPFWNVNGSRLMMSLALAKGVNYYVLLPPGGPLYSTLYGPMAAIVYLPATLLSSPNSAVLAGSAITILLCFSAVAYLHFAPLNAPRNTVDVLAFLTAGFLVCYLEPLKYSCFNIHADGPGLAFGAAACGVLYPGNREKWRMALPFSALFAILSISSKQMFLPVPFALLAWLMVIDGGRLAMRYLVWLVVLGALVGATALFIAGPENLYHSLIWMPAHHPWNQASHVASFVQSARHFIRLSMPVPVLLLASLVYWWMERRPQPTDLRAWADNRCVPLLLVGVALLPFSIAGRAKTGGDINSLSFALFFLACGLTVMLADVSRFAPLPATRLLAVSTLVAIVLPLAISEAPLVLNIRSRIRQLPEAGQQVAFAYLTRHPGEAYFPWFPLAHYFAEHQFRHYGFGIADRLLAHEPLTMAEFRAYVPSDPRIVAFAGDGSPDVWGFDLMQFFPEYNHQVRDPDLPGWQVYAKALP
jgi:hypothetical protein